ncbi:glycosyltransferase family 2 protein [Pendulispora albinea]|uniref:Glycosyltransferase family 2 protein n=1 Tax=Pendulispora albinea TaxID=2741071 RepID=A0ABZ2LZ31_9BACT
MSVLSTDRAPTPLISVVVPVYNEGNNLEALHARLESVAASMENAAWEYLFVNDGSTDHSLLTLQSLARKHQNVKVIDMSRNFGKELALTAGVAYSKGHAIVCIDADLQHPPEVITQLVAAWRKGAEVVVAVRRSTEQKAILRRLSSRVFNSISTRLSETKSVAGGTDFRLLDRRVRDALLLLGERRRLFRGLVDWLGFERAYIEFDAAERWQGRPTYSFSKLWDLAIDGILAHSSLPLRILLYLGVLITFASGISLVWMQVSYDLVSPRFLYTPLARAVVFNTLLNGIVLTALGILGLYVSRIHTEVLGRPLYTVRATLNLEQQPPTPPALKHPLDGFPR